MTTKSTTVHYRRLADKGFKTFAGEARASFIAALDRKIDGEKLGEVDSKRVTTSPDGREMCLLNPTISKDLLFGEISVFRDGDIPIAETDPEGQLILKSISLGEKEVAVVGTSYFLMYGSHMAITHQESSTRFVREYLNWFLRSPIGTLDPEQVVNLMPMAMAEGKVVGLKDVKSLKIRGEINHHELPGPKGSEGTFSRFIEKRQLAVDDGRALLRRFGLTGGELSDQSLEDLEFELIVKKREKRNLQVLPDQIIDRIVNDGVDAAAEFQTDGTRRRGNAVVMSHRGEVDLQGAYFELGSVRRLLVKALEQWGKQGLI